MQKSILIPAAVSSIRIAVLPLLFYLDNTGKIALCLAVFAAASFTDLADGFLARKLKVTTRFGAYFDSHRLCLCHEHIRVFHLERLLLFLAVAPHYRGVRPIRRFKPLHQKTP